ncbi:hypothetical protein PFLUV_G00169930 [Perca fluviatilis]|uniref:Uncharacterized protein n=1 Tax=Perca fluviatilis TaxID=8168 RepID=A0A6A5EZ86_PERFL|nr:hypothetical protein PFLUV_G00169930 [Perca fluviatilis]
MNGRTILLIGSIVFIVLVLKAAATVPKAEQRKECENVQLSCPKSLEAAVGDDITLDFHLEPRCDATNGQSKKAEQSPIPNRLDSDIGIGYARIAVFAALLEKYGTISTSSRRARRGRNKQQTRKEKNNNLINLSPDNI